MKRYYVIVWQENLITYSAAIDAHPADWLIQKMIANKTKPEILRPALHPFIINQFEITAEQYQALESLQ